MMADEDGKPVVTFGPKSGECAVCGKDGPMKCGRCQVDFYCGRQHQVQHWPQHRKGCGSFELRESSKLGRYVVATKDIPAGAILMREIPLVVTPTYGPSEDRPVCVGCLVEPSVARQCPKCGWPVCGDACSVREVHQPECAAFQRAKYKLPKVREGGMSLNASVSAISLRMKKVIIMTKVLAELEPWNPDLWKFLGALRVTLACENQARGGLLRNLQSDHSPLENFLESADQMRISAILMVHYRTFKKDCDAAVSWIRDVAGLKWLTAEAVRRGAGICFINSNSCSAGLGRKETAVFAGMSLLEHSCRPNTDVLVWQREDGPAPAAGSTEYVLVASRNIARGEHLTLAYLHNFLLGSVKRRAQTLAWNFLCQCELCRDPSQRGLHLEAWCCAACSGKKKKAFPVTIHDMQNSWSCSGCGETGSLDATGGGAQGAQAQAKRLEKRLENYVGSTAKVPLKVWEQFIHDALWPRGPLHPTHSLVLQAKKAIVELDGVLVLKATLTPAESRRVAAYCRDLLAVSDAVCPGVNWFRQQLLLVHAGVVEGLVEAQMESMRTMRPPRALEKLLDEMEEIHTELTRIAVSPKHKKTSLGNLEEIAATRNAFSVFK
ncbi:uncharacterized protein LOC117654258 isoform X2 [Thrips palmi]|uniref:Uncharacterized protein LOC117654258 isoform X2 n=2 Tax=Thrips palmi TaxID=161013 RepID=A0A6P9AE58_THRPL|nr:uncharacterized protein LOC117654258 isoform X2 [Thrips palmi]